MNILVDFPGFYLDFYILLLHFSKLFKAFIKVYSAHEMELLIEFYWRIRFKSYSPIKCFNDIDAVYFLQSFLYHRKVFSLVQGNASSFTCILLLRIDLSIK